MNKPGTHAAIPGAYPIPRDVLRADKTKGRGHSWEMGLRLMAPISIGSIAFSPPVINTGIERTNDKLR